MDATDSIDSAPVDPRNLAVGTIGLLGLSIAGYGVNAKTSLVDGVRCTGCAWTHPLVAAALVLGGLALVGLSLGFLARTVVD